VNVARLALLLSACSFRVAGIDDFPASDLSLPDLIEPPADLKLGEVDAATNCDPQGSANHCSTDQASVLECRPDGSGFLSVSCSHGCGVVLGVAGCLDLEPSGVAAAADYRVANANPTITSNVVFNTDDGSITGGLVRPAGTGIKNGISYRQANQGSGVVSVGIFGFAGLTVGAGVVVRAHGSSALAVVSSGDVLIAGTLDLQDDCLPGTPAAGGGAPGTSGGGAGAPGAKSSGGGGGGHGDVGGAGGASSVAGGSAGAPFGPLEANPLVLQGGGGGGAGGSGGAGGNGGGAVQLASNGKLTLTGVVHAGGCGGLGGGAGGSGGGGGAGGAILFEAAEVVLAASSVVAANGGGGGAGGSNSAGAKATATTTAATGGAGATPGGSGGAKGSTSGKTAPPGSKLSGGGGGAAGRIAIKTQSGSVDDRGAVWSPSLKDLSGAGEPLDVVGAASFE
jgi:hypothetical protein